MLGQGTSPTAPHFPVKHLRMPRLITAVGIAIALLVPAVLTVGGIRVVTNDTYVRLVYDHGGIPRDRYGMSEDARKSLALAGLDAIQPGQERGIAALREQTLPTGVPAFGARELSHMEDVRTLLRRAYLFQIVAALTIAALAVLLGLRRSTRAIVPVALARGALLTVALAVLVAVLSLTSYGWFSTPFHSLFFEGDTWRFTETDTLRRLYPDRFWLDTAIVIGVLAVLQAIVVFAVARLWARWAGARQAFRLGARTEGT
jgi:integral membrane protein (TIGR01906 family)